MNFRIPRFRPYILFLGLLCVGIVILILISSGYYPIAFVGGSFVTAREFRDGYQLATAYSQSFEKTYGATSSSTIPLPHDSLEVQAQVLDQLIENVIVSQGLKTEVGDTTERLVMEKVDRWNNDATLHDAAQQLFGTQYDDFKESVLMPQAEREVLSGRLFLRGEKLDDWLQEHRDSTHVIIFSGRFNWESAHVAVR